MNKQDFIEKLRAKLSGLPRRDVEERLSFYSEMIDERMEEGLSEEDAVAGLGSVCSVASQIIAETPLIRIAGERIKPKRKLRAWEIVLLALGSPIWLSLLVAALAVTLSLYAALGSVIVSLWAVFGSLVGCVPAGIITGIGFAISGNGPAGIAMIGAAAVCAGLSILLFFGCKEATKGTILLTKKMVLGLKNYFVGKEKA